MRKSNFFICFLFGLLILAVLCSGCSDDSEKNTSGRVDQMTDKIAHKAVQNIRQPLEKARQAQDVANAHIKAVDEAIEQSSH